MKDTVLQGIQDVIQIFGQTSVQENVLRLLTELWLGFRDAPISGKLQADVVIVFDRFLHMFSRVVKSKIKLTTCINPKA